MASSELNALAVRTALERRRTQELIAEEAEACQASFRLFVEKAWPVIEPVTRYVRGWHIDAICDHLQAASLDLDHHPPHPLPDGQLRREPGRARRRAKPRPAPLPLVPRTLARARTEERRQPNQPLREHAHRLP